MKTAAILSLALSAVLSSAQRVVDGNVQPFQFVALNAPASVPTTPLTVSSDGLVGYFNTGNVFTGLIQKAGTTGQIPVHNDGSKDLYLEPVDGPSSTSYILGVGNYTAIVGRANDGVWFDDWTLLDVPGTSNGNETLGYAHLGGRWSACEKVAGSGELAVYWTPNASAPPGDGADCQTTFDFHVKYVDPSTL